MRRAVSAVRDHPRVRDERRDELRPGTRVLGASYAADCVLSVLALPGWLSTLLALQGVVALGLAVATGAAGLVVTARTGATATVRP